MLTKNQGSLEDPENQIPTSLNILFGFRDTQVRKDQRSPDPWDTLGAYIQFV